MKLTGVWCWRGGAYDLTLIGEHTARYKCNLQLQLHMQCPCVYCLYLAFWVSFSTRAVSIHDWPGFWKNVPTCCHHILLQSSKHHQIIGFWRVSFNLHVKLHYGAAKKSCLEASVSLNYWPISNLTLSKLLERIVFQPYNWSPDAQQSSAMTPVSLQMNTFCRNCTDKGVSRLNGHTWQGRPWSASPVGFLSGFWAQYITPFYWSDLKQILELRILVYHEYDLIYMVVHSRFHSVRNPLHNFLSTKEYHKGQSLATCYSSYTPLIFVPLLLVTD